MTARDIFSDLGLDTTNCQSTHSRRFAKLPRSRSSPSPPSSRQATGRKDSLRKHPQSRPLRRRPVLLAVDAAAGTVGTSVLDWSTSYQAGSSSSASHSSSDDETEDEQPTNFRGRAFSNSSARTEGRNNNLKEKSSPSARVSSPHAHSSGDSAGSGSGMFHSRVTFTRSRSPASGILRPSPSSKPTPKGQPRHMSPSTSRPSRHRFPLHGPVTILPAVLELHACFPLTSWTWTFSMDIRKFGESLVLLASLLYAALKIRDAPLSQYPSPSHPEFNIWITLELHFLSIIAVLYTLYVHSTFSNVKSSKLDSAISLLSIPSSPQPHRPSSPRLGDNRRPTTNLRKSEFGFIWMSVPKNYRESCDDGIFTGLLLGPLIAAALLVSAQRLVSEGSSADTLPAGWLIEAPAELRNFRGRYTALEALALSRYSLVDLATFCSTILLVHVCSSWWLEARFQKSTDSPEGERPSVPRSEGLRTWYYISFTFLLSVGMLGLKILTRQQGYGIWQHISYLELLVASSSFQFILYMGIRLAHRGFTLGELGLVCFGGTALIMEFLNITVARIWPVTTPFIKTFRLPTPLLIFQMALIAGSFLTGFLLSPFLVLSRHIAQRPVRRLRFPEEKQRNRRYFALGFYIGTVLIVGGLIGMWTRWCLGKRDPWLWVVFRILEGKKKWTRPALLAYWAALGSLSVAGWNRQLARSRRYRPRENLIVPGVLDTVASPSAELLPSPSLVVPVSSGPLSLTFSNLPNLPNGANVSNVATDLLDAADKHVPTLGLNARRKFFHGLAVVMFLPGVAIDPAFTHLSFSAAFALFTFTEYVRYFAVYPFGAAVHLFMNEFLDPKDSGTAILSHFYLLTGCAGSVWLEGPSHLLQFTGILALGVGDALASIVGKRIGTHRWSPTTSKTLEGSLAFTLSIVACAWALRVCGFAEEFSTVRYSTVIGIASVLEALSDQNDNLTLPLYMWSLLVLAGV